MTIPLELRHDPSADAAADAWFLIGGSAERWLDALVQSGLATAETRLYRVPVSAADRSPAGLLVLPARSYAGASEHAGMACRLVAGRLVVPLNAVLFPPVTDAEIHSGCPLPVSFFHPAFGLSGFDEGSSLRVWDLLKLPGEIDGDWNAARPGSPALPELRSVQLSQPPSIEDLFGGAEDDIGSQPLVELPPAANEPGTGLVARAKRRLDGLLAQGLINAMRSIPPTSTRRTWANALEGWAQQTLSGIGGQLDQLRHRELHRLLDLLNTDPESGLRHAIPLNAFAHRGLAPPGARLGSRSPNFDLSRLGGRAADFWNVPPTLAEVLRRRYREMADREMQLGRHRRAAYIYAELLGDLVSAANALKQGRFFHEAARLYEEPLGNPVEAARCLADGGLLPEAIDRYIKLDRWLEVADLHERMQNHAAAEEAVRRVVQARLIQGDVLGAAKLLEERLKAPEEALEQLLAAWPSSRQAVQCIGVAFQILARLGRHQSALELLGWFSFDTVEPLVLPLLNALGAQAQGYPDASVRQRAADFSRVLIARQLAKGSRQEEQMSRLMECLVRLAPHDRLLARDANRHLFERRDLALRTRRAAPLPVPATKPIVVRRFELPRQMEWLGLCRESHWFFALGVTPKRVTLVRGVWEGDMQSLSWNHSAEAVRNHHLVFTPTAQGGTAIAFTALGNAFIEEKRFPAADLFFDRACVAGTPGWLKPQQWPVAFGEEAAWTAHVAGGRGVVSCHDKLGRLQRTLDVTEDLLAGAEHGEHARLCLAVVNNSAAVAWGNRLVLTSHRGDPRRLDLPGQVIGLAATLPHTRAGLVILLQHGALVHWLGAPGWIELDRDLASPQAAFVSGGPLVVIAGSQMVLFDVDARGVQKVTRTEYTGQRPVGICSAAHSGQFGVLGAKGEMTVYRVPQ